MRNKTLAAIFAFFFGGFGVHRFYLGQVGLGLFYAFFFWTGIPFLLGFIDALVFFGMSEEEFNFRYNKTKATLQKRGYTDVNRAPQPRPTDRRREQSTIQRPTPIPSKVKSSTVIAPNSDHKKNGVKKFKDFDYQGAITDFEKALEINNRDIATHFNLACAYSLTEEKEKAFYHINQAVLLGFNDFERIHTHESLAFMRIQDEYIAFKASDFKEIPAFKNKEDDLKDNEHNEQVPNAQPEVPVLQAAPDNSLLEELERLKSLHDLGVLNDAEFEEQKEKLKQGR